MLVLNARLRFGAYEAADERDSRQAEWPPHPARLFCALVASDPSPQEWTALEWLEAQPPPIVIAPAALGTTAVEQFVPTNSVGGRSPNLPGRSNATRVKPRALPRCPAFHVVWADGAASTEHRLRLDALAQRVPYVGRSTGSAALWVSDEEVDPAGLLVFEPTERFADRDLRIPYPGYGAELRALHEAGRPAWEASLPHGYAPRRPAPDVEPVTNPSPFGRLLVFRFVQPAALHASRTVAIAERLQRAVVDLLERPLPRAVSGQDASGEAHVAYLGLPNVSQPARLPAGPELAGRSNAYADGRLLALGLAVPKGPDMAIALHEALVRGVNRTGNPLRDLDIGLGHPRLMLAYEPTATGPMGARADRWTRSSTLWATATPVVLDRYPKGRDPGAMVAEALVTAGYPEPVEAVADRSPILHGAPQLERRAVLRRAGVPTKPWFHAWVRFESPQQGPVLAGSMRYRGLGLFAPLTAAPSTATLSVPAGAMGA